MREDLHAFPRIADSISHVYFERCRIEQDDKSVVAIDANGRVPVPCASLLLMMLGPGTTITHAAVRNLADCGCTIVWAGESGVRLYAAGLGVTRSSRNVLRQAHLATRPPLRLAVARRMYELRFDEPLDAELDLRQVRGKEGVRVRDTYARESARTGVPWFGRAYKHDDWRAGDAVNQALSAANACLYGVVHAAIVATGYSPALGFIHTGNQRSFVLDIADLYKTDTSIPAAFDCVAAGSEDVGRDIRVHMRDHFVKSRLLARVVRDIAAVLDVTTNGDDYEIEDSNDLWGPDGDVPGGTNWAAAS